MATLANSLPELTIHQLYFNIAFILIDFSRQSVDNDGVAGENVRDTRIIAFGRVSTVHDGEAGGGESISGGKRSGTADGANPLSA